MNSETQSLSTYSAAANNLVRRRLSDADGALEAKLGEGAGEDAVLVDCVDHLCAHLVGALRREHLVNHRLPLALRAAPRQHHQSLGALRNLQIRLLNLALLPLLLVGVL